MISDLGFVFNREEKFKDTKYIIVVSLEKVDSSAGGWEGKIGYLKGQIDQKINHFDRKITTVQKMISEDLQIIKKALDGQLSEIKNDLKLIKKKQGI